MSIPLLDINVKYIVDYGLKVVRANPDEYLPDIFGDAKLEPNARLYGDNMIEKIKSWLKTTKITTMHGWDLSQTELPAVTINLASSTPSNQVLGDVGFGKRHEVPIFDRDVLIKPFAPAAINVSADGTYADVIVPATMSADEQSLIVPGLSFLDASEHEYAIGYDGVTKVPTIVPKRYDIAQLDARTLSVISPYHDAYFREGSMVFQDSVTVDVHGHQNRNEGQWLWCIVTWALLRFRPLLIEMFGMDLQVPSVGDISMDASLQGTNVWVRRIQMSGKTVWSWRGPRRHDILGLILFINERQENTTGPLVGDVPSGDPDDDGR
jgi:hypothetical protein